MRTFLRVFLFFFILASIAEARGKGAPLTHFMGREIAQTMHFSGAEWLIRETRENEEASSELLRLLEVEEGLTVCDLGCGNGYHAIPVAKKVGANGKVFAVDIQPEMLDFLRTRSEEAGVENIVPILGALDDPKLPENSVDLILLVDVYHEFSHPQEMLRAMRKSLKPEGRIALVEFREEDPKVPIKPLHKMSKAQMRNEFRAHGFKVVGDVDVLPWQHLMFFGRDEEWDPNMPRLGLTKSQVEIPTGNRLVYLDNQDPYYVSRSFPKLTTPQWVGEEWVEGVVVLSIDDLGDSEKYETYLRPILDRLAKIDGRAALSITTNRVEAGDPQLQEWIAEGLSLDTHTSTHACPMLHSGDLAANKLDYDRCVDLLASVPGNRPVAFRVPCCDSMNATSPRFFTEIFNKTTGNGSFMTIDTSVFHLITSSDPELPTELTRETGGLEKFGKYLPTDRAFSNWIEDYPYPYVIERLCWEMAAAMPSDWDAQHYHNPNNPFTVEDLQDGIDAALLKKGVFTLCFHPHGWIRNDQVVELIDHSVHAHGDKVRFLNFREVQERIDANLLLGQPLRAEDGGDNGVRLLDVNRDGFLDVAIGNDELKATRVWSPETNGWIETDFPVRVVEDAALFGTYGPDSKTLLLSKTESTSGAWIFEDGAWKSKPELLEGLQSTGAGARLRDLDGNGACEFLVATPEENRVAKWNEKKSAWVDLDISLPEGTAFVDSQGRDAGLRFIDADDDGYSDVLFSNESTYSLHLFESMEKGWSRQILKGEQGDKDSIPPIVRDGTNNGASFHDREMWVNNENTRDLPGHVRRVKFNDMLGENATPSISPEASLQALKAPSGFEIELVAAEPMTMDPVALDWGPDGKLWVVEMADYPDGMDNEGEPGGRVRYLEDRDGNGTYESSTLFLDGLPYASGVMAWKKGVLVAATPDVLYAEDTDGDGKADIREVLYSGFGNINEQHLVNGFRWGLDNWVYLANGDSGGDIRSIQTEKEMSIRGRDLKIRPEDGGLETVNGQTQYLRSRDDWGDWFGNSNSNPLWQFVTEDRYIGRNPHIAGPRARSDVSDNPGPSPVFPRSRTLARFNDPWAHNRFTSCSGSMIYRDDLLGAEYAGNSFVSESVHNLVHREPLRREGILFTSGRAPTETRSEFLASTDTWFRPALTRTGPDGALWVVDMCREHIEHTDYIPEELRVGLNLRSGDDLGRIYRIYPTGAAPRPIPNLAQAEVSELVRTLEDPSGTLRDLAHRLLVERGDQAAIPLLRKALRENENPLCRLHSLCCLDGLGALDLESLEVGLSDAHPGVRRNAVRLCETLPDSSKVWGPKLLGLVDDPDAPTRMRVAYTLGEWDDPKAAGGLARLAEKDGDDVYLRAAILSSLSAKNVDSFAEAYFGETGDRSPNLEIIKSLLGMSAALGKDRAAALTLSAIADRRNQPDRLGWCFGAFAGLMESLERAKTSFGDFKKNVEADLAPAFETLDTAREIVSDEEADPDLLARAIPLMGRGSGDLEEELGALGDLLAPQASPRFKEPALASLGRIDSNEVPAILFENWKSFGPALRGKALDTLIRKTAWTEALFTALEDVEAGAGAIAPTDVDALHRQRLMSLSDEGLADRAKTIFAAGMNADRARVLEDHASVLTLPGDTAAGEKVFEKACASCHLLKGLGKAVGPDIAGMGDKSPEALLIHVLDPNRNMESKYLNYIADTFDGETHTGMLIEETDNSVTLAGADGAEIVILRADLDSFRSSNLSFMPEGLEADLKPQDLADLFAFIAGSGPERRVLAGNEPKLVSPEQYRGEIWMMASESEVYGEAIDFKTEYENLGAWTVPTDFVVWSFKVTEEQSYFIVVDYACDAGAGGNSYEVALEGSRFSAAVEETGSWDNYRRRPIGEIALEPGEYRLTVRATGKLEGPLFDLRAVGLQPAWMHR